MVENKDKEGKSKILKKLKIIEEELVHCLFTKEIIQPDSILKNVDPSIEATELIEQIQHYSQLIHQEINVVVRVIYSEKSRKRNQGKE